MKNSYGLLILFLLIGLLTGSLIAHLISSMEGLSFLTKSITLSWSPQANFDFLKYELDIQVKINLLSLLGLAAAFWVYRRTR